MPKRKNNTKTPCLVTGGAGFVGRHLVSKLLNRGEDIWIVDDLSTGKHPSTWLPSQFKKNSTKDKIEHYQSESQNVYFINQDLINVLLLELYTDSILPSFSDIFHLASIVGGRSLIDGDPLLVAKDLSIDSIFFLWATRRPDKINRILYASSSAAYPIDLQTTQSHVALKETMINFSGSVGVPDMTYGWSKLTGEYLSRLAASKYGLSIACVRPFSGYGEDQDLNYPIPAIARRVALREHPLTVWGTGKQGRDFVHIDDCVDAFFIIMDKIHDGSGCNIGSGKVLSFLEVLGIFSRIEGYKPEIKPLTNKPVGVSSRYSDPTMLSSFGWKPSISYEEGFRRVLVSAKNRLIQELLLQVTNDSQKKIDVSSFNKSEFLNEIIKNP